jgi:hypothetical protein
MTVPMMSYVDIVLLLVALLISFSLSLTWSLRSLKLGIVPGPTLPHGSCQPLVYGIRNAVEVSNFSWNDKKTRQGNGAAGYVWNLETSITDFFVHICDFL